MSNLNNDSNPLILHSNPFMFYSTTGPAAFGLYICQDVKWKPGTNNVKRKRLKMYKCACLNCNSYSYNVVQKIASRSGYILTTCTSSKTVWPCLQIHHTRVNLQCQCWSMHHSWNIWACIYTAALCACAVHIAFPSTVLQAGYMRVLMVIALYIQRIIAPGLWL